MRRLRSHPDPRVSNVAVFTPGVAEDVWGSSMRGRWIDRLLEEWRDIEAVGWDPYSKFHLEELANYAADVRYVRGLVEAWGSDAEIGFFEFGIHGGPPTFDNVYGSRHAQLYLFGTIANSANAGLRYPFYFSTFDALGLNHKGLMGSAPEAIPPYTRYVALERKPQYYAMQVVGEIAKGELVEVISPDVDPADQLDVLASSDGGLYRAGIQNRFEAATRVRLLVGEPCVCTLARVVDDAILVSEAPLEIQGALDVELAPWSLQYVECASHGDRLFVPRLER